MNRRVHGVDDGPAGGAAHGAAVVGGAVTAFGAAAPVRLDLAGGWTDVPPFSAREGGVVVAAAMRLCAHAEVQAARARAIASLSKDLEQALEYRRPAGAGRRRPAPAAARGPAHAAGPVRAR